MRKPPKPPKPFRVERAHCPGCLALAQARKEGGSPFTVLAKGRDASEFCNRFANPHGRRGAHHYYVRFICNDPACPSAVLVHAETMLDAILSSEGR